MKYKRLGDWYVIKLGRGDEVIGSLAGFSKDRDISGACFQGIGALRTAKLAHFNPADKRYSEKTFAGPLEIAGLTGNVSKFGKEIVIHAHMTVCDSEFKTSAGHLREAVVEPTCEIFLRAFGTELNRKKDTESGLNLLDI